MTTATAVDRTLVRRHISHWPIEQSLLVPLRRAHLKNAALEADSACSAQNVTTAAVHKYVSSDALNLDSVNLCIANAVAEVKQERAAAVYELYLGILLRRLLLEPLSQRYLAVDKYIVVRETQPSIAFLFRQ